MATAETPYYVGIGVRLTLPMVLLVGPVRYHECQAEAFEGLDRHPADPFPDTRTMH